MNTDDPVSPASLTSKPSNTFANRTDLAVQMPVLGVIPQFTAEEIAQIKALVSERTQKSKWRKVGGVLIKFSTNPLTLLVVGFLLTGWGLSSLNNTYAKQQQELAAMRSFSDELNKLRIQKVGEVWERLDEDEFMIDEIIREATDEANKDKAATNQKLTEVIKRLQADRGLVTKYRFWLGKRVFDSANEYLNANIRYILRKLTGSSEEELKQYLEKRNAAKSDIDQVREQFLSERGLPIKP